ncbi:MAG: bifunctional diaminohydroxyphosphoribosylaminopyrimidine deaminase/5-amino-6-(5-phosphoribosylamino)uracil reductase RibD [Burkholderiaceae bacterium]|nr:bifunctional diaminohydroxyphosphoribosylaminopyrimidine deaminase/5-amino-6-(5-phosphoribosylamino)uracil reductase RibD [Burkholderiaceae bacterium]
MSFSELDFQYMQRALGLARLAQPISMPNPAVGCVLVRDGVVIGEGHTLPVGNDHAEVQAVKDAHRRGNDLKGATAYVTLEPCSHYGRTPPCALRLIEEGLGRVVIACLDPNPLVAGRGVRMLKEAGIEVDIGLCEEQAWLSNAGFMTRMVKKRPWVRLKVAMSLDGQTALANGVSQWITGAQARQDGHRYRARSGAIVTGIGTVLADDPQMTVRNGDQEAERQPLKVVLDSALKISLDAKILQGKALIVTCDDQCEKAQKLREMGAEVVAMPAEDGRIDLVALLDELGRREINDVHLEAGAILNGAFLDADLVDEMVVYMAPKVLGNGRGAFDIATLTSLGGVRQWRIREFDRVGADLKIILTKG